jgi:hypothetical protein
MATGVCALQEHIAFVEITCELGHNLARAVKLSFCHCIVPTACSHIRIVVLAGITQACHKNCGRLTAAVLRSSTQSRGRLTSAVLRISTQSRGRLTSAVQRNIVDIFTYAVQHSSTIRPW